MTIREPRTYERSPLQKREKFTSKTLSPYRPKRKSIDQYLPWLCVKDISTRDFSEVLAVMLGPDRPGPGPPRRSLWIR